MTSQRRKEIFEKIFYANDEQIVLHEIKLEFMKQQKITATFNPNVNAQMQMTMENAIKQLEGIIAEIQGHQKIIQQIMDKEFGESEKINHALGLKK